jgi:prevent-host-death family protein
MSNMDEKGVCFMQSAISSTEVKAHFGKYLEKSLSAPVHISKTNRSIAVLLSEEEYERLTRLEDAYWGQLAEKASKEGYASEEEVKQILSRFKDEA